MAFAVGDLIDPDAFEAVEAVAVLVTGVLGDDPFDHPADRRPVDTQEFRDNRLRGGAGKPHHRILEPPGETRPDPGPRHDLRTHTTRRARHAPDITAHAATDAKHIEVTPRTRAVVIHRPAALPAPRTEHPAVTPTRNSTTNSCWSASSISSTTTTRSRASLRKRLNTAARCIIRLVASLP